jgi:broad specificity phosphatase PhoE
MAAKRNHIMLNLIRCGETRWDHEGRMLGSSDLPLSDAGRAAIADVLPRLAQAGFTTVYHPPDEAAAETAKIIAHARNGKTKVIEDFAEPELGLLEGLLGEQFAERYPKRHKAWKDDPLSVIPPEGEPMSEARARVFAATAKLLKRNRTGELAIVLHPIALGLLRCWLAGRPPEDMWTLLVDRRRVERYAVAIPLIEQLRATARTEAAA